MPGLPSASAPAERNPALPRHCDAQGFRSPHQGHFYDYFVVARTLSTVGEPTLATSAGVSHERAGEVSRRLMPLQREGDSWTSRDTGWWESEPILASSYALLTHKLRRASRLPSASKR